MITFQMIADRIHNIRYEGSRIAFEYHSRKGLIENITMRDPKDVMLVDASPEQARNWLALNYGQSLHLLD